MRAFVTGAAGFVGGVLAHRLRDRGDDVVAIVRDAGRARRLEELGCSVVVDDLVEGDALAGAIHGCDAAFHVAGAYRIGIPASERPQMHRSNVTATARVLDAAIAARIRRTVYVSTINVFGNTRGDVVDETYRRDLGQGFLSYYDETKYLAHLQAEARVERGEAIVIVMPGQIYGPGDHSATGGQLADAHAGRLRAIAFPDAGLNFVHVEDVVDGILRAHDAGRTGESYVVGGQIARMREAVAVAARIGGRAPPRLNVPTTLVRLAVRLGPVLHRMAGLPPNLREVVRAADGVTYWATDAKARAELGYSPRPLEDGLRATFGTGG